MEKHFCDNDRCKQEIRFGGAEPESKLLVVVDFMKVSIDKKAFEMGYGIRTKEDSLGKLFFCCKGCVVEHFNQQFKKAKNAIRG